MKKFFLIIISALVAVGIACAGQAKVSWQEPDTYTDIREGHETRDAFRQTLFGDFGAEAPTFVHLGSQLRQG